SPSCGSACVPAPRPARSAAPPSLQAARSSPAGPRSWPSAGPPAQPARHTTGGAPESSTPKDHLTAQAVLATARS
ncbi:hypothetical protein E1294_48620, partial [Nonomuraea diastatica]